MRSEQLVQCESIVIVLVVDAFIFTGNQCTYFRSQFFREQFPKDESGFVLRPTSLSGMENNLVGLIC